MTATVLLKPRPMASGELLHPDHRDQVRRIAHELMHRLPASVDVTELIDAGLRGLDEALRGRCRGVSAELDVSSRMQVRRAMIRATDSATPARNAAWYPARETALPLRRAEEEFGTMKTASTPDKDASGLMSCNKGSR